MKRRRHSRCRPQRGLVPTKDSPNALADRYAEEVMSNARLNAWLKGETPGRKYGGEHWYREDIGGPAYKQF